MDWLLLIAGLYITALCGLRAFTLFSMDPIDGVAWMMTLSWMLGAAAGVVAIVTAF